MSLTSSSPEASNSNSPTSSTSISSAEPSTSISSTEPSTSTSSAEPSTLISSAALHRLSPQAFSRNCPHPSWTRPYSQNDEYVEELGAYGPGGFHYVVLGDTFNNKYTVVHKLGQGGNATVWLVWDQMEKRYVALKIVSANGSSQCQELEILQYLGQLNIDLAENFICPLLDHFWIQGQNGSHVCLVLPLAGLRVFDEIANSESYTNVERVAGTRYYGRQLAHAVALLHSVGIVHGDLTRSNMVMQLCTLPAYSLDELYDHIDHPQRILHRRWRPSGSFEYLVEPADLSRLPTNKTILLVDFGEAFFIDRPPRLGLGIPIRYATPEGVFSNRASPASDIWAIGCVLYEWWTGQGLFAGEDPEEMSYEWTDMLGKLPEPYCSQYPRCGEYLITKEGCQVVKEDLEYMMKQHWDRWSTCPGTLKKMEAKSLKQICDSVSSSFSHNPPEIRLSVVEDEAKGQLIIAPDFLSKMKADSISPVSRRELHSFGSDFAKIKNVKQLMFYSSNENYSEVQLPPLIAGLYCLLRQLLTYDPDKRLPALFISQHSWFSTPRLDESCEPAKNQDIKQFEPSAPSSTTELKGLSKSVSHSKLLLDENHQPAKANQDIEQFGNSSTPVCKSKLNSPSKLVFDSNVTKMSMPSKWSLALNMENGTWKHLLSSDIERPNGDNESNFMS